jgi:energy-coupling factor transporter ATP-binding protein EcfA2
MRVLELEIRNVRGIPYLSLKPTGNNFVVWGPNGSGKSAVVDAIDFLLTGRISRLTGKGTGGITLSRHGPHIDHKPKEATVRAVVQLPGLKDPVEIRRCMADPSTLECDEKMKQHIEPIMMLAKRGQHVLTRRDILRYITAEASTRAQEIQELLNITEIEEIRKTLVKVQNKLEGDCQDAKRAVETARGAVNATMQATTFNKDIVLQFVNQNRAVLGGQSISTLHSADLKTGLTSPTMVGGDKAVNITLFERDIQNLRNVTLEENQTEIAESDKRLRELVITIRSDPQLLHALSRLKLTNLGITLIDETGSCPLCDTAWPPGKLREYLEQKISAAQVATQHQEGITKTSATIARSVSSTVASVQKVISVAQLVGLNREVSLLQSWLDDLQGLSTALSAAVEKYPDPRFGLDLVKRMLAHAEVSQILTCVETSANAKYPETTPEQNAWDTLTRLQENLKALESADGAFTEAELSQERADILLSSFLGARDAILTKLYDAVRDRFVDLYRQLHKLDEDKFTAKIIPAEAGLDFEVDFYGRGTHPPHALHSEGHQDSMGLCLYLALAERLTKGRIDLVILDDVVMSIDADHRRQVCRLLATFFPTRQFLITTHDRTWANQLRNEGVVDSRGTIEFYNWHVNTGPQVNYEADMWERIEEDLQRNDVPSAAARLRRGSEQFFGMVCDALQAQITYKLSGLWELGDFLPAAMGQYHKLLRQAKCAAQSWDDKPCFEMLQELDSTVGPIYVRSNAEQWAVNANVHYNNWANFSEGDFRPVVEAFQDLYGLFVCSKCGGMLHLATSGITPMTIRCNCGQVDWNLMEKGKNN